MDDSVHQVNWYLAQLKELLKKELEHNHVQEIVLMLKINTRFVYGN